MDSGVIGAVFALLKKKVADLSGATQAAAAAAKEAEAAAKRANNAADSIIPTTEEAMHTRIALNYAVTILQAEQRAQRKDIDTLKNQVKNITG